MSSKVLYPPAPTTPTTPLGIPSSPNQTSSSSAIAHSTANDFASRRPRRAAAIASQAATLAASASSRRKLSSASKSSGDSSASSSTLPHTPQRRPTSAVLTPSSSSFVQQQHQALGKTQPHVLTAQADPTHSYAHDPLITAATRPMAALPRAKRARRGDVPRENGMAGNLSNGASSAAYGSFEANPAHAPPHGHTLTSGANKGSIIMGIESALNQHHMARTAASDSYRNGDSSSKSRGLDSSVREMIGGQEREIIVLSDSTSPEAGMPDTYYTGGVPVATEQNLSSVKGKRKAAGTPSTATGIAGASTGAVEYAVPTTASKRRRKDAGPIAPTPHQLYQQQRHEQERFQADAVRNLYANNADPSMVNYPAALTSRAIPPGGAMTSSYRGGYPSGNTYYNQQQHHQNAVNDHHVAVVPPAPVEQQPTDGGDGHFIVRKGDYVTDRYQIVSLLGQGTFGKVVKCRDLTAPRQVAIKIIRAVQKYTDAAQIEIRVLRTLRENDPHNENKCIHLLETFTYRSHVCIVSELLGQSVFDFLKDNDYFPFPSRHIWSFAKQLLRSVAFLHRLGLVHTDLKPENILLVDEDCDLAPISWRANAKKKRVLRNTDIRLIDFGSATFNDEYHSQVVSTRHYRAPEIILTMGWSFPCDAWSIGCILIEFYTGEALFQTHDNLEHLAMMEAVLGNMPDDFRRKAETYKPQYFRNGRLDFPNSATNRQSRKYVKGMKTLSDTINSPSAYRKHDTRFRHLLERLLTFDPNQRIRVEAALKHPYFDLTEDEIPP